jgi:putative ATP-binding cassette transporter
MELKRLGDLLWKLFPNLYFLSIALSVVTGLCYAMLVPFVMYSIGTNVDEEVSKADHVFSYFDSPTSSLAVLFLASCLFIVVMKGISTTLSMYVTNCAAVDHRLWLYRRIQNTRLADLEKIGQARLINVLNIDIPRVTDAATSLPQMWISIVTVLGVLGYLTHLNTRVFGFVIGSLVIAVISYQLPLLFASNFFRQSRDSYDRVQQGVTGLIFGTKELKLNRKKADAYYKFDLLEPEAKSLTDNLKGNCVIIFTETYGGILSFLIIGVVVFHFRYVFALTPAELLGLSMALLYLAGPLSLIMIVMGNVRHGQVSLRKLQSFYGELGDEVVAESAPIPSGWEKISVHGLNYNYGNEASGFAMRDVNLQFARGEITFIIGGNGSGKSTLGKCLSFHYLPVGGHIQLGDTAIDDGNIESARQFVSAIFPDYYLFKKLYTECDAATRDAIAEYLKYLELDHKVSVIGDEFSTTDLSEGQRKRLALLAMLMEDRPICVFDEWAADQDPVFKEVFYSVILQDLKAKNKVVIVISHDDRYFIFADQIISMESGLVVNAARNTHVPAQRLVALS